MEKSYRIVSLSGGANGFDGFDRSDRFNGSVQVVISNYIQLLLQFRTDIKLFHWQTKSFAHHKISDELLGSIDDLSDKLVEDICGLYGTRPEMSEQTIILRNVTDTEQMISIIRSVATELKRSSLIMGNSEIANIRDELLGSMDKTLYLLSFK